MTTTYKEHRSERTAKLHKLFDTLPREKALKKAVDQLGYTKGGAMSWFNEWASKASQVNEVKPQRRQQKRKATRH